MSTLDRFYKKEEMLNRTLEIDEELYQKLEYLSKNVFDASVNKLVNASIEQLIISENVELFKSKRGNYVTRSFSIRASFMEKLYEMKKTYRISMYMLINIAVKNMIDDYEKENYGYKKIKTYS